MTLVTKQHLIDPEICIRCYTCEDACSIGAITHNDDNVVVDASICAQCMDCIGPCPTGSIDNWRVVETAYTVDEQLGWVDLPVQVELQSSTVSLPDKEEDPIAKLLAEAQSGASKAVAPLSASSPKVNIYPISNPIEVLVKGNFRLTGENGDSDVRHIILDFGNHVFPYLEGQSIGITPPGIDANGKPFMPRLYTISSPRGGERENFNNLALTVKREDNGVCSNFVCDLTKGSKVMLSGPFGESFLMPDEAKTKLLMICTGTGSAPFRAFTMRRQRAYPKENDALRLFFGARTPGSLPYFGPMEKIPESFLAKHFAFSRDANTPKTYVQDEMRKVPDVICQALLDPLTHIYLCGLKDMEEGVELAFEEIARENSLDWENIKDMMQQQGRYHVETY